MHRLLSYQCAKNADRQTDSFSALYNRFSLSYLDNLHGKLSYAITRIKLYTYVYMAMHNYFQHSPWNKLAESILVYTQNMKPQTLRLLH